VKSHEALKCRNHHLRLSVQSFWWCRRLESYDCRRQCLSFLRLSHRNQFSVMRFRFGITCVSVSFYAFSTQEDTDRTPRILNKINLDYHCIPGLPLHALANQWIHEPLPSDYCNLLLRVTELPSKPHVGHSHMLWAEARRGAAVPQWRARCGSPKIRTRGPCT
jgi:hypothetical protein